MHNHYCNKPPSKRKCNPIMYNAITMLLVIHIAMGILSLVLATAAIVAPSMLKLRMSYGLVAATLASGIWLVTAIHAPIMNSCLSGLIYLAAAASLVAISRHRLSRLSQSSDS